MADITFTKSPAEVIDYTVNWYRWIPKDRLTNVSYAVQSGSATVTAGTAANRASIMRVSGGAIGETTAVVATATTESGQTLEASIDVKVEAP